MSTPPRTFIFHRYELPRGADPASDRYADTPVVSLTEAALVPRHAAQAGALPAGAQLSSEGALLEPRLDWAFGNYILQQLSARPAPEPIGSDPERALPPAERAAQLALAQGGRPPAETRVVLFNVLVAIEWRASQRLLRQLAWAFRRASDFLYDVTDGRMAFGQVVFGGPELMPAADIQIMASSRYHPRSWTDGLHNPAKYQPIRVGRGVWDKGNRISVPWDEPESFRTLVHEWGHYALALKDEYLSLAPLAPDAADPTLLAPAAPGAPLAASVPGISLALDTIMSTLSSSELMAHYRGGNVGRRQDEWGHLRQKAELQFLQLEPNHQPLDGPMELPLPLPGFATTGLQRDGAAQAERRLRIPADLVQPEHCWVFLLSGEGAQRRLIPQGSVDARAEDDGFLLLGAEPDSAVLLIGVSQPQQGRPAAPVVLRSTVRQAEAGEGGGRRGRGAWADVTPAAFPVVDVIPAEGSVRTRLIVHVDGAPPQAWRCQLFELAALAGRPVPASGAVDVSTLDGYVLLESADGRQVTVVSYSQGGGPGTSPPVHANPTSAGSSEGNVMLFYHDPAQGGTAYDQAFRAYAQGVAPRDPNADLTVITTLNYGLSAGAGQRARSYAFSVAAARPLPQLSPTLVMFYDGGAGRLRVCRMDGRRWVAQPTFLPDGQQYAALPLTPQGAPSLFAQAGPRVERFMLCEV